MSVGVSVPCILSIGVSRELRQTSSGKFQLPVHLLEVSGSFVRGSRSMGKIMICGSP